MEVLGQQPRLRYKPNGLRSEPPAYWPRRLLHIPTWCSHERSKGNEYGTKDKCNSPRYSTLSYTWGRYTVSGASSDINIGGVPSSWNIPLVDTRHFTTGQLKQVIKTIAEETGLDYLWIDIACIKTEWAPEPTFEDEVFMQQDIFRNAAASFVWLSRTSHAYLQEAVDCIQRSHSGERLAVDRARVTILKIIRDPWFTALWTLLEGTVPGSIILSSEGGPVAIRSFVQESRVKEQVHSSRLNSDELGRTEVFGIDRRKSDLSSAATSSATRLSLRDIAHLSRTLLRSGSSDVEDAEFEGSIKRSGLLSFEHFSLLSLYSNAQHRQAVEPGFRLRYINDQIFGFPSAPENASIAELEHGFNLALRKWNPVLSQLFVRRNLMQQGRVWDLDPGCDIPDLGLFTTRFCSFECKFKIGNASLLFDSPNVGLEGIVIEGCSRDLKTMAPQWLDRADSLPCRLLALSFDHCRLSQLDESVQEIPSMVAFPNWKDENEYSVSAPLQREFMHRFMSLTSNMETRILVMARGSGAATSTVLLIGLILVRQPTGTSRHFWKRAGLCFWMQETDSTQILGQVDSGCSSDGPVDGRWEYLKGYGAG